MQRYILRRILQGIITVLILLVFVFGISRLTGNPLDLLIPDDAPIEVRERMEKQLGLDQPLYVQFSYYLRDVARGDLGTSIVYRRPATELFFSRFPKTLQLLFLATLIAFTLGVPLGIISATHRGRIIDRLSTLFATFGIATPHFFLGLILMLIFAVNLGILPVAGAGGPKHYILPAITLSTSFLAGVVRILRSSMLETLDSEYVKLARIKGVSERGVIWRHALRNSLTTVVSFTAVRFAVLITGAIVTETVFAWPGVGQLTYKAIVSRDYPLVQGIVLLKGIFIIGINLILDVTYAYLDPRIRYGQGGEG